MSPEQFDHVLSLVEPMIAKRIVARMPICAEERLAITLRFLASGESKESLSGQFMLGKSTVTIIVDETCDAIWTALQKYVSPPKTEGDWKNISNEFEKVWNMPHCIGALDGKHIQIQCPNGTGSLYHNYKGTFSLVLMAVCDARYCFSLVDIGAYGSNNDAGVWNSSEMGKKFASGEMNLPQPDAIPGIEDDLPYFLVGDEIFPLTDYLMRPIPGKSLTDDEKKIFNYRLSRARRTIENVFGILVARFRIFKAPIEAIPEKVVKYVLACVALHNYLRQTNSARYTPTAFIDSEDMTGNFKEGEWRNERYQSRNGAIRPVKRIRNRKYNTSAIDMRNDLVEYLASEEGSLPWQLDYVRRSGKKTD